MNKFNSWLKAFRLRTLPLSLSGIIVGTMVALYFGHKDYVLFVLALLTVLFLQILSNLANDLGDTLKGADDENRVGPKRTIQSGEISHKEMKNALIIFSVLSLFTALPLAYLGTLELSLPVFYVFIFLSLSCVLAAITYTIGRKAYGYIGLGDLFVFFFFGLVSVCGIYVLIAKEWNSIILLPAIAVGLLSTAVLNLNNLRDFINDKKVSKKTFVVQIGIKKAKIYHAFLIFGPFLAIVLFSYFTKDIGFLFLLAIYFILIPHIIYVFKEQETFKLDSELKKVALTTFLMSIILTIWVII